LNPGKIASNLDGTPEVYFFGIHLRQMIFIYGR
jgi:hypothetical protein